MQGGAEFSDFGPHPGKTMKKVGCLMLETPVPDKL